MIRRGRNTSEFFITLLAGLGVIAGAVAQVIPPDTAGTLGTIAAVAYVVSRGLAKLNNPALNKAEASDSGVVADLKLAAAALESVIKRQKSAPAQTVDLSGTQAQAYGTPGQPDGPLPPASS